MSKEILTKSLPEYLPEFYKDFRDQLISDDERWGDTWKERGLVWEGWTQEERFYSWLLCKWEEYRYENKPFPWLKIAGEAMIDYIREKYLGKSNEK